MKRNLLKLTATILSLAMIFSTVCIFSAAEEPSAVQVENTQAVVLSEAEASPDTLYTYLTDPDVAPEDCSNSVVIPGVFQSRTRLYNEDGTVALNSDGEEYGAPFFLESTGDIVKYALRECLVPLLLTLITQRDWNGRLATNVAKVLGNVLGEKARFDAQGKSIYNVKADKYPDSVATLSQEDKDYIYDQIPLNDYADICGEDHLYFYSYCSFGNIDEIVDELYALIKKAALASPTGKANIIPISQGGTLANNLLDRYPEVGQYLDRIIYIVPALDGTVLLGEIYENGLIDDDEALYNEMFPILIDDDDTPYLGYLINILLRILPNSVVNDIIDKAVDVLIGDYLRYVTTMWALVPQANYPAAAAKYLNKPEDAFIKAQTDRFYNGQVHSKDNILYQINTYGVKVFDIVDYNSALYPIVDSWDDVNGDGIIQVSSTSMGATSFGVDVTLPVSYTPAHNGKYVDRYNIIDAGTGLLPDHTFYFHNQNHERTGSNDVIMKLAICLLTDSSFTSVDSYPEKYPQFNEGRVSKGFIRDVAAMKAYDTSALTAEDAAELAAALAQAEAQINNTVVDPDAFEAAQTRFYAIRSKINGTLPAEPTVGDKLSDAATYGFTSFIIALSDTLYRTIGGKGFSDIVRIGG